MRDRSSSEVFRVIVASDQEHEKVVAEIYRGDDFVVLVSQDHGTPMVEIPGSGLDESRISRIVPLKEFHAALEDALQRLNE